MPRNAKLRIVPWERAQKSVSETGVKSDPCILFQVNNRENKQWQAFFQE